LTRKWHPATTYAINEQIIKRRHKPNLCVI